MKLRITVDGVAYDVDVEMVEGGELSPATYAPQATPAGVPAPVPAPPASAPTQAPRPGPAVPTSDRVLKSPLAGTVIRIDAKPGDRVKLNQKIMVMEAMKMETDIVSTSDGEIKALLVNPGDAVKQGQPLVEFA